MIPRKNPLEYPFFSRAVFDVGNAETSTSPCSRSTVITYQKGHPGQSDQLRAEGEIGHRHPLGA